MKKSTNKILWLFAIGQLGWSILSGIISNWLVFFYQPAQTTIDAGQTIFIKQGTIFLGITILGFISAVGRIFDAVTDPLIASKSDRSRHKDGRRIPFMRAIAIPFGIITVLVFWSPVNAQSPWNSLFLLIMCLTFYLFMTIYCTPFNALIPELGKSQKDRINLSTYISITFFLGTSVAYLVPNIAGIFESSLGYVNSFRVTIAILAVIAVICMLVPVFTINEKDYTNAQPSDTPAIKSLSKTFSNKNFRRFVGSDVLYWIALTIFQTGLPFYVTALMKLDTSNTFLLFAIMSGLSFVFYIPVNLIAKKIGKKKLVISSFILFSAVFLFTSFAGKIGISGLLNGILISVFASIPMAILGILPQAMVADVAEADSIIIHENRNGMFFAARTFAFKLGQSVAMLIFTGVAKIGTNDIGYRISAIIAAVLCLVGALILFTFDEKGILKTISDGADKNDI